MPASVAETETVEVEGPVEEARLGAADRRSEPVPPVRRSFYYGWVMLPLATLALVASSPGQTFGVSIFNEPMRQSLSLSHGQFAAAYMLGTALAALPIWWFGALMDRHGLRRTLLVAVTAFSLACVLTAGVQNWLTLFGAFFCLRTLGPGALAFLSSNTLSYWFEKRLGLVESFRALGMAGATCLIPQLNLWLERGWGWRGAYAILGIAIWILLFPVIFAFFRNRPRDVGQRLDGEPERIVLPGKSAKPQEADSMIGLTLGQTLRTYSFWIVTWGTTLFALIQTAIFFSLVPILKERGMGESDATAMMVAFALGSVVFQLLGGALTDRFHAPSLLFVGVSLLSVGVAVLAYSRDAAVVGVAGALLGASQGLFFGASQPLWARYFGRLHLGKIRGLLMTLMVGTSSLGPLAAGLAKDWLGSFDTAMVAFVAAPIPVAILCLAVAVPREYAAIRDAIASVGGD